MKNLLLDEIGSKELRSAEHDLLNIFELVRQRESNMRFPEPSPKHI